MKNTMKAIAALIISATMISITACGNTGNTSSAPPKATTTASSTEASATTTTEATLRVRKQLPFRLPQHHQQRPQAQAVVNLQPLPRTAQPQNRTAQLVMAAQ